MPDLIVRSARVVNATGRTPEPVDIAIEGGVVTQVGAVAAPGSPAVVDADGATVIPGVVDPHVHVSGRFGFRGGFRMMVRGGVTSCLDLAGDVTTLVDGLRTAGCGMTAGVLFPIVPGESVDGRDPSSAELATLLDQQLAAGALGLKVLGGHYPITPAAIGRAVDVCQARGAYIAIHVGSTETGSDIRGLEEVVDLVGDARVQVAHVNSYCRGQVTDPVEEAARAIAAVSRMPNATSESYLAVINGADASHADGVPVSNVVKTCLRLGGFDATTKGLESAIDAGWARIHTEGADGEISLADPATGLGLFRSTGGRVGVSFPVNPPAAAIAVALGRKADGSYAVDAFSSDGGSMPRNTTLRQAMGLVAAEALTLEELVLKACVAPARMLGLERKGRIAEGADADLVVVGTNGDAAVTIAGGRVVYDRGAFPEPAGGRLFHCSSGSRSAAGSGLDHFTVLDA